MFNKFIRYVGKNFGNPNGIGGKISTKIMNVINQKQYKTVLENIESKDTVLDIGFGNGYLIEKLFKNKNPIIYGIEISKDMLEKVKERNVGKIGNGSLKLSLEDISKTSFRSDTFDKVYTVNTVYFWKEPDKCFTEIKRILKQNGVFLNVIYTKEYLDKIVYTKYGFNKFSLEELEQLTVENGMNLIKTIEIQKNKSYCIISGMGRSISLESSNRPFAASPI
ncbi:class I SAM-dependent methyltransferase [Leadbettera azotonutricia]|uniref:Methyltransferase family protein n=1 Tax=Leadbettera azotonutricia (strain ATCC BAA-888 / DSM 13862 / ZAS-9) TaxID=545695 RepID=F5Y9A9_LEAAZ|nr:class I SAM-dependent methyltransferase [Leadbettera azotonutricia]AEF82453.1 methyltransferase family protein [Leadbettera azotonutricia ZAS-9]